MPRTLAGRRRTVQNFPYALQFNKGTSYETVTATSALNNIGVAGQSFWVFILCRVQRDPSVTIRLIEKRNASDRYPFAIRVETSGVLTAAKFDGSTIWATTSTVRVDNNQWHAVLMYLHGTTVDIYMDGTLVGTNTLAQFDDDMSNIRDIEIGRRNGSTPSLSGAVQTVAIGIGDLTNDQIASLSYDGNMPTTGTLLLHLPNATGSGSTVTDLSGNGHNGILTSTVWSTASYCKSRTLRP